MITISKLINYLETHYPKHLAFDKDPIGLHIGTTNRQLSKVLITLDVTELVVREAIEVGANLIIAHHPFIYRPLATINTNTPKGKIIELCLKHDISIYSMHTNYDIAPGGMNDCLAEALELTAIAPLIPTQEEGHGLGRMGQVKDSMPVKQYIDFVKEALHIDHARYIGKLDKQIKTVAVIGGSGGSYVGAVKAKKADLFITGDVGFHDAQDALDLGLNVLDVGHHVETIMISHLTIQINEAMGEIAIASTVNSDPFKFI